jgi:hypothetical protein
VDGGHDVAVRCQSQCAQRRTLFGGGGHGGPERLDDRVAGHGDPVRWDPFREQVVAVQLGRRATEVGEVVDDDAVVFLRHGPVVAAQAGLDVHQWDVVRVGRQRSGERGGGVTLDEHRRRRVVREDLVDRRHRQPQLPAPADTAAVELVEPSRLVDVLPDLRVHRRVVVLSGVDDGCSPAEVPDQRREFDQLGAGTAHERDRVPVVPGRCGGRFGEARLRRDPAAWRREHGSAHTETHVQHPFELDHVFRALRFPVSERWATRPV